MLLFCRAAAGFCRASVRCSCMCAVATWLCSSYRGQSGHSVTTDGQEKPRGHLKSHRQCRLHTVCVCVCGICVWHSGICVCVCVCVRHNGVADRSGTTPLSCNKCHPCLLGLPSKSSDQSHTYTHKHIQVHTHGLTHNMATRKQISLGPDYIQKGQFSITWTDGLFISLGGNCAVLQSYTHWKDKHA